MCAGLAPHLQRVGPCVCVELKPKGGRLPHPGAPLGTGAAAELRRRVPRYSLHMLLKHAEVGARAGSSSRPGGLG